MNNQQDSRTSDPRFEELSTRIFQSSGIQILGFIEYRSDRPSYLLKTNKGEVRIPTIPSLIRQGRLRALTYGVTAYSIPDFPSRCTIRSASTK